MNAQKGPNEWMPEIIPVSIKQRGAYLESHGFKKIGTMSRDTLLRELQSGGSYERLVFGDSDLRKYPQADILVIPVSSTNQVVVYKKTVVSENIAPLITNNSINVRNILNEAA